MNIQTKSSTGRKRRIVVEAIVLTSLAILMFFVLNHFQVVSHIIVSSTPSHTHLFAQIITALLVIAVGFGIFSFHRWMELRHEYALRERSERALRISEERFKSLINSLDDVVFTLDKRGRHTAVYGRWVHGYEKFHPDSFIGKTARELFGPEDSTAHEKASKKALAGESTSYEWSIKTNGSTHHFEVTVSPLRDEHGSIIGVVGVGHDVTDKKRFERELRQHEQELRALVENSPDIIVRYDRMERYVYVNRAFETVLGMSRDRIVGKKQSELSIPKELTPFWQGSLTHVFHTGQSLTLDAELPTPTGIKYFDARLVPELSTDNKVESVLVVARDLTKYKQIEVNLRRNEEHLERIIQTTPGGVTILDMNGRIFFANPLAEQILGLKRKNPKERYYKNPSLNISTLDGHPLPEQEFPFIQVMMTGEPVYGLEHAIQHPDGKRVILSVNAAPLYDYNNKLTAIITSITDITRLKEAEETARKNEQRFRDLANSISDVFFAVDNDLRCTYWNRACETLTGILAKNAISQRISNLLPNSLADELGNLLNESRATQITKPYVAKVKFQGKVYHFDINIYPAKHGLSVFLKDVSERTFAERERERLITELQDALSKVKTLSGLLPICAFCKKIRDDGGYWHQVEAYIKAHSGANFSHGVCPECAKKHYPEYYRDHEEQHQ